MKGLLVALLAINIVVAAGFLLGDRLAPQPDPNHAPLNADRISLGGQQRGPAAIQAQNRPGGASSICVAWRDIKADARDPIRELLKRLVIEQGVSFTELPVNTRSWVIFPSLPSVQSAADKLRELNAIGITEAFVVRDGAWRNAISLGLYANDSAASRRLQEIEARGVLGIQIESIPAQGTDYYFIVRSDNPDVLKSLAEWARNHPGTRQSRVACPS